MAQKELFNWQDGLNSFDFNQAFLGVFTPGRYTGFDAMNASGLNFTINHLGTGIVQTDINKNLTNPIGTIVTKQGMIIQEDAAITGLSCATNSTNTSIRNDLLVLNHFKVNTPGGTPATYIIVKGPTGSIALPSLPLPNQQVIIAVISIPANATTLSGATYTKQAVPLLGNSDIINNFPILKTIFGQLATKNFWLGTQYYGLEAISLAPSTNMWIPSDTGNIAVNVNNLTVNEIQSKGGGGLYYLYNFSNNLTLNINGSPTAGGLPIISNALTLLGISTITLNPGDCCLLLEGSGSYQLIGVDDLIAGTIANNITAITALQRAKDYTNLTDPGTLQAISGTSPITLTGLSYTTPNDGITRNYLITGAIFTSNSSTNYLGSITLTIGASNVISEGTIGPSGGGNDTVPFSYAAHAVPPNTIIKFTSSANAGTNFVIGINGLRSSKVALIEF